MLKKIGMIFSVFAIAGLVAACQPNKPKAPCDKSQPSCYTQD